MSRRYLTELNVPNFFELAEDFEPTDLETPQKIKIVCSFEVVLDEPVISEIGLFTPEGEEVHFNELCYNDQKQALSDLARMSQSHIDFYRQDMLDFDAGVYVDKVY